MKRQGTKHPIENGMALLLFAVFAVSVLGVLLLGADGYHRLTERSEQAYRQRTCTQYIATRVRQADCLEGIAVESFGDGDCLTFAEEVDGVRYLTRLYCYEGTLRELLTPAEAKPSPQSGEVILEAQQLQATLEAGFLTITLQEEAVQNTLRLSLRSGEVQL